MRVASICPNTHRCSRAASCSYAGKVVLPDASTYGPGPYPAVVIVHGSEDYSAVDYYSDPISLCGERFRRAGPSTSAAPAARRANICRIFTSCRTTSWQAVRWLRTQPGIDGNRIHLAGFSQGGWIAPLAALKDGNIRSLLVGYGVMVPVTGEDRWGYFYALQQKGLGADALAAADRVNALIEDIVDRDQNRWSELGTLLDAGRSQPWFAGVRGSDSMLGVLTDSKLPLWAMRVYLWWRIRSQGDTPFIDRVYDPVPTMQKLQAPSLWLLGGEDSSAPTPWTLRELQKLQAEGRPVQVRVFPDADHGIIKFVPAENGERRYTGLEPDYYPAQIAWLRANSGS
jgi:dienelactone hydrolase